ncbi:MAG TPA: hypothetical protein VKQ05_02600 [Gemmatimonadales bacterium]|nr:hypothetical protein [Gemmatimonadales bacterium]
MRYLILLLIGAIACAAVAVGCGNPLGLPGAYITNRTDTISLYALSGTPVYLPSGYSIATRSAVRTEQSIPFDFAFDIDSIGEAVLYPTGALKLGTQSGLQISAQDFDSLLIAPTTSYKQDTALVVTNNSVVVAHSGTVTCSFGILAYYYAKLHVLAIDTTTGPNGRRIDFEILTDVNCGYRGLNSGLPSQ